MSIVYLRVIKLAMMQLCLYGHCITWNSQMDWSYTRCANRTSHGLHAFLILRLNGGGKNSMVPGGP